MNSGVLPSYTPLSPNDDHTHIPKTPSKTRIKKSVENNAGFDEDSQLYDQVASGLKKLIFEKESNEGRSTYDDLQGRIDDLKYQLESRGHSKEGNINPILTLNNYQPPYYQRNFFTSTYTPPTIHQFDMTSSKKNDIFTALVIKILDKLIASTPAIVERLFGQGLTELSNFEGYGNNVGNGGQNDVQNLLKSLGVFGYGPLIFLRLVDGFTTFMNILRRNEFFKNFLTPALILLLVSGAVVFLVWWLQPDPKLQPDGYYDKYNGSYSNYNYHGKGYGNNYYNYGYKGNYGSPVYSRSYLDDVRRQSSFT